MKNVNPLIIREPKFVAYEYDIVVSSPSDMVAGEIFHATDIPKMLVSQS